MKMLVKKKKKKAGNSFRFKSFLLVSITCLFVSFSHLYIYVSKYMERYRDGSVCIHLNIFNCKRLSMKNTWGKQEFQI